MRQRCAGWLLVVASLALPAAAGDLGKSLQGRWKLDKLAALEATGPDSYKKAAPEQKAKMREQLLTMLPDMTLEVTKDQLHMMAKDLDESVSYVVTKVEGRTVSLETTEKKKDGTVEKSGFLAELMGGDGLRLTKKGDPAGLVFKREK